GIPPEALPRVFEPYYRVPDAAGAAHGTGIGLAVVKALVEAHGGTGRADSAPALGPRATIVRASSEPAVPSPSASLACRLSGLCLATQRLPIAWRARWSSV